MKVVILQRILPDYRCSFYKQLQSLLQDQGIELVIFAGQPWGNEGFVDARDQLSFVQYGTNVRVKGKAYWLKGALRATRGADLVIFEQANAALYTYPLIVRRLLGGKQKVAFWGHGAHMNRVEQHRWLDGWKYFWSIRVDHWFAYTDLSAQLIQELEFTADKITAVQNAIDVSELMEAYRSFTQTQAKALFKELFNEKRRATHKVGVFCARLVELKWVPFLLSALKQIHEAVPDFRMILIGDGPEREAVQAFCADNAWCRWMGAVRGEDRAPYLSLADVFLNPGMSGLAILDAFSTGTAFVTTENGIHSPEIDYLEPGVNGLLTAPDVGAFVQAVIDLLGNEQRLNEMKENAFMDSSKYTIENMAENYAAGILRVLKPQI